jgi:hypothetical protein
MRVNRLRCRDKCAADAGSLRHFENPSIDTVFVWEHRGRDENPDSVLVHHCFKMSANKRVGEGAVKVAIVGGGPAGLAAAIELSKLPFVEWSLYEQKLEISEISTGITLQRNSWRLLEKMGVSKHLKAGDFFRPPDGHDNQYR